MEVKDRLLKFIEYKGLTQSDFGKSIGVSAAFISSMRKSIQPDKIKSIALTYPELDIKWLMTGLGEMIVNNESNNVVRDEVIPYGSNSSNIELLLLRKEKEKEEEFKEERSEYLKQISKLTDKVFKQSDELVKLASSNKIDAHLDESAGCADASNF